MWLSIPLKSAPAWACLARDYAPGSPEWALPLASGATLNGKHTQPQSWQRACKTARWMRHLSGPTFSPSTLAPGLEQWIASLRASRARTCPLRGDGPGLMANEAASSSTSSILPTLAVRDTSFWRTSQASLLPPPPLWTRPKENSLSARPPASWENWPTAGGTRNGSLFQRPTWAPATGANGGFAGRGEKWTTPQAHDVTERGSGQKPTSAAGNACLARDARTWPTPDCNTATYSNGRMGPNIREAAAMWMTPNVPNGGRHVPPELVDSKGRTADGQKRTVGLESQTKYWNANSAATNSRNTSDATDAPTAKATGRPTPRGTDGTKGGPNQAGSKGDLMLPSAAAQWPTPAARDSKGPNSERHAMETGGGRKHMDQLANFVAHSSHQAQPTSDGPTSSPAPSGSPRPSTKRLNPYFTEWLMGWPAGWTSATERPASSAAEMASYRFRLRQQLSCLFAE